MYKLFLRPILFLFDPEKIHYFTFSLIRVLCKIPFVASIFRSIYQVNDKRLERTIFGLTFKNPSQNFVDVNGDGSIDVSQEVGNAIDKDGDGVVDGDLTKLGKGIPDFELGWSNTLQYKNWDVNAFFRGAFGHSLVNNFRVFYEPRVGSQGSYNLVNTKYADPNIKNAKFSSLYVEKADFIKLDNLSIGYNFDISDNNKYFKSIRLSLTGQNLFVITGYSGVDPEPSLTDRGSVDNGGILGFNADPLVPGIDRRYNYFSARTFTLGLNINF